MQTTQVNPKYQANQHIVTRIREINTSITNVQKQIDELSSGARPHTAEYLDSASQYLEIAKTNLKIANYYEVEGVND